MRPSQAMNTELRTDTFMVKITDSNEVFTCNFSFQLSLLKQLIFFQNIISDYLI